LAEFKCRYCGKAYKTQKGFEKHHCEKMDRYNETTEITDYVYNIANLFYKFSKNIPDTLEERKLIIINSRYYKDIKVLEKWAVETNPINFYEYVHYLYTSKISADNWTKSYVYKNFLFDYLAKEPTASAIERAEKYLANNGLTINTISSNRLYLAILYGHISKKYLDYIHVDVSKKLDPNCWEDVRHYFIDSNMKHI
jgi:hypothetical protein